MPDFWRATREEELKCYCDCAGLCSDLAYLIPKHVGERKKEGKRTADRWEVTGR